MIWKLVADEQKEIPNITSFKLEQQRGKPALLSWCAFDGGGDIPQNVSLFRDGQCLFNGRVLACPISFKHSGEVSWVAIGAGDNFSRDKQQVLETLTEKSYFEERIAGMCGGEVGFLRVDPVSHAVRWVSAFAHTEALDLTQLYDRESRVVTPLEPALEGVSVSISISTRRELSGMMDVGPYITGEIGGAFDTYSGDAFERQFEQLSFRMMRAGYDVQHAGLERLRRQSVDLPKYLRVSDTQTSLEVLPLRSYKAKLLCSWMTQVHCHQTLVLKCGDGGDVLTLCLKADVEASSDKILSEMHRWLKAYAKLRSFNTQVKFRVPFFEGSEQLDLKLGQWVKLYDDHSRRWIEGPLISTYLTNEEGVAYVDLTLLWAKDGELPVGVCRKVSEDGDEIEGPAHPGEIISNVQWLNDAEIQRNHLQTEGMSLEALPMSRLEIEVLPIKSDRTEYKEIEYQC